MTQFSSVSLNIQKFTLLWQRIVCIYSSAWIYLSSGKSFCISGVPYGWQKLAAAIIIPLCSVVVVQVQNLPSV